MQDDLERQVVAMLARDLGLPIARIRPSSRLLDDLGMEGDDAVAFFIDLKKTFGTDLSLLERHWPRHFSPEGLHPGIALVIVPCVIAATMIVGLAGLPKWTGVVLAILLIVATIKALNRIPRKSPYLPITVADVVGAVKT